MWCTLPEISVNRLAIKLKPAAERMVKKGHPWVFTDGITKISGEGKSGDLAIIFDNKKNKFLACGFYDPESPIRIKLLVHHQSAKIDRPWFSNKINKAFEKRKELLKSKTNSYRLLFGENDGLPSLITDVYAGVVVVKIYSAIWFPYLKEVLPIIQEVTKGTAVVLRLSRNLIDKPNPENLQNGQLLYGELPETEIEFMEHGVRFSCDVVHGHKTGHFLDHRHNRKRIGELAKDKKVLDVFSYSGGFSVHALAGGASEVTSIDISAQALEMAKKNAALNKFSGKHKTMAIDAFEGLESLKRQGQKFDLVVIDPPSFAKKINEIERAKVAYRRLAKAGIQLTARNGILLLASCSSRVNLEDFELLNQEALQRSGRKFKVLEKTQHDIDHPIGFPEGAYLKSIYYQLY